MSNKALVWVRDDFRINNNDALIYASNNHDLVTVVFIFNNNTFDNKREAQKWWLSKSLESFRSDLKKLNIGLEIIKDDEINFFSKLKSNNKISVYWNKVYEPAELDKDKKIGKDLTDKKIDFKFFKGNVLNEYNKIEWSGMGQNGVTTHQNGIEMTYNGIDLNERKQETG